MLINTSQVESVIMNRAIPANHLGNAIGIDRSAITRVRNGERKVENLTLETIAKVQQWINDGNYTFSYDYSDLIEELEADIEEGLAGSYIYIVRGEYREEINCYPIIDYYYTAEEIEEGDIAEKVLTQSVLAEMKSLNEIF